MKYLLFSFLLTGCMPELALTKVTCYYNGKMDYKLQPSRNYIAIKSDAKVDTCIVEKIDGNVKHEN